MAAGLRKKRSGSDTEEALKKLDGFLCELKELQIRDGLHVLGQSPDGELLATGGEDGLVKLWEVDGGADFCERVQQERARPSRARALTREQPARTIECAWG